MEWGSIGKKQVYSRQLKVEREEKELGAVVVMRIDVGDVESKAAPSKN
jgi:hypothetical protein